MSEPGAVSQNLINLREGEKTKKKAADAVAAAERLSSVCSSQSVNGEGKEEEEAQGLLLLLLPLPSCVPTMNNDPGFPQGLLARRLPNASLQQSSTFLFISLLVEAQLVIIREGGGGAAQQQLHLF